MRTIVTSWGLVLGACLCFLFAPMPALAKEVQLEEVNLSLYNKPVTGFRMVLDRSERFVANQIIEHVAASDDSSPFQYERSIIYENIRYEPISDDHDLSLYFLLKSIQGQYTELTVVVMYDYRRAINSRDFPALTQKLKIDLGKFVRHVTGDVMLSDDILYDDAALAKLDQAPQPKTTPDPQPMVEHFKQEETDRNAVLLNKNPFSQPSEGSDSTLERLKARIADLERQATEAETTERNLRNEQASMQRKQDILMAKVKDNKALHDSITLLNLRVEALINQAYVADDVSVSNETASELANLERENARYKRQMSNLGTENDSLRKVSRAYGEQLNQLAAGGKNAAEQLVMLSDENKQLKKEIQTYQTREALSGDDGQGKIAADSLLNALAQTQLKMEALNREVDAQNRNLGKLRQENDALTGKKMQLEERMASLESENRALREGNSQALARLPNEQLIDSLNGEIRNAKRSASVSKAELVQVREDMQRLQKEKDAQESQLNSALNNQKSLQSRIDALLANSGATGNVTAKTTDQSALRDSVLLLQQQLRRAEAQAAEASADKEALSKTQAQLQVRERELRTAQSEQEASEAKLTESNKSKAALQKSLNESNARLTELQNGKGNAQQEFERLQQENRSLTATLSTEKQEKGKLGAENKTLNDSLAAIRSQRANLRKDIAGRDASMRLTILQRDSLQKQVATANNRENDLRRNISALQNSIDSLSRVRVPEGDQARYLKEQRTKLDQAQKELEARQVQNEDREKLLSQRESVMQRKEADMASSEARFKNLEEREKRLQLLEQQLNAREGLGSVDATPIQVREGRVVEFGAPLPVFIVESGLGIKAVQRQVVGYMLSREELLDSQFPEILYRTAHLGELDSEPVELKIRIDTKASGTVLQISIRLTNGEYLGGERYRERNDAVKQLISKMLRYKI